MSLHAKIMNLQPTFQQETADYSNSREAYKYGHRDARHAAAELALEADAELDALRKDAERYRWLRQDEGAADWSDTGIIELYAGPDYSRKSREYLDAAIDAAKKVQP